MSERRLVRVVISRRRHHEIEHLIARDNGGFTVGCTNILHEETIVSARTRGDTPTAVIDPGSRSGIEDAARAAEALIDRSGDRAISRARAGDRSRLRAGDRAAYGYVAESAVARHVVEVLGHDVIHLNTQRGEKGIDLVTFDSATGQIFVWEAKSSLSAGAGDASPQMRRTNSGKQMSEAWLNERLAAAGLDVAKASDIQARAVKIDLVSGKAQTWVIDPATGTKARSGHAVDIEAPLDLQG